jgi:hypothetical protein
MHGVIVSCAVAGAAFVTVSRYFDLTGMFE